MPEGGSEILTPPPLPAALLSPQVVLEHQTAGWITLFSVSSLGDNPTSQGSGALGCGKAILEPLVRGK